MPTPPARVAISVPSGRISTPPLSSMSALTGSAWLSANVTNDGSSPLSAGDPDWCKGRPVRVAASTVHRWPSIPDLHGCNQRGTLDSRTARSLSTALEQWPGHGLLGTPRPGMGAGPVSYTHLRAHETRHDLVCRLLLE